MITNKVPEIQEAKDMLRTMSADKELRIIYESRQKSLKEQISSLSGAEEKGKKEKAFEIAKNLLQANIAIEIIASSTGLTKEEIEEMKE